MKTLLFWVTMATTCLVESISATQWSVVPPESRLELSKESDHILLVEVKAVERKPPRKSDDGIEISELVIRANVIEVIRGVKKKEIEYTDYDFKVVDRKAFKRSKIGDSQLSILFDKPPASGETGSGECKVGERYVMVYFLEKAYFVRVLKGDESWRGKIVEQLQRSKNK